MYILLDITIFYIHVPPCLHQDDYHYTGYLAFCLHIPRVPQGRGLELQGDDAGGSIGTGTKEINEVIFV